MIQSYCDISATPAFQFLVTELSPTLGDKANREVFRDYLEYNGNLRTADEIITKLSNDYFSTVQKPLTEKQVEKLADQEIVMTNTAKFKELGVSVPKKQISEQQIINLRKQISKVNNELAKKGINRVYTLSKPVQVGQSDNFTWEVKVFKGNLDVGAKVERLSSQDLLMNRVPRLITQGTKQLELDLQNNIRTALLGIDSTTNGNKNSGTGNVGINNKMLGKSIQGELSDTTRISTGELRPTEKGLVFHGTGARGGINISSTKDISGKTFKDIFSSNEYGDTEQKLYIISRLFESLRNNKVNRGIKDKLYKRGGKITEEYNVQVVDQPLNNYLFSLGGDIVINLHGTDMVSHFKQLYKDGVNLDDFVDIAIFEELIHSAVTKIIPREVIGDAMDELAHNSKLVNDISQYYSLGGIKFIPDNFSEDNINNLNILSNELVRAIVQKEILGISTEDIKHIGPSIKKLINNIWEFLRDLFQNSKIPQHKKIADQITEFIKGAPTEFKGEGNDLTGLDYTITTSNYAQQIIRKMADALGQQVGVNYSFISPQEAIEITKNAENPWTPQSGKSFFFNGQVYFLEGTITPSDVLHEFVHPIIKNIAGSNKPLFNNLYQKAQLTNEGKMIIETVQELYPNLDSKSDDFKEEVLVRSIEKMRDLNNKGLEVESAFQKFVNDLLFSIKQLLRGVFGQKIKISDLSPNTTLKELSEIIEEGGKFELDPEIITDVDLVAYKNEYNKVLKDFVAEKADKVELENLTNKYFETVKKFLVNMRKQENLGELANVLENKYGTGELQKMQRNLKSYQTTILQDSKQLEDEIELTRQRTAAVINSLGNADNMIEHITAGLKEIVKDINNPENVKQVLYYQKFLNYWGDFVANAAMTLEMNGVRDIPFINNVVGNVDKANKLVNDFYLKSSKEFLTDTLTGFMEGVDEKAKARIEYLKAKNAPKEQIDKAEKEWKANQLTPKMIDDALRGNLKDMSWAGAYMEEFGSSPDPVAGGLALFIKNRMTKMEVTVQQKFSDAATELKPLLEANNYNQFNSKDLGEKLGQKELVGKVKTVSKFNEQTKELEDVQELEETEIWRFRNQFKGADIVRDRYLFNIKQAGVKYSETKSDEDKQKLADIQSEWADHKRKFWNDKYTEDFYKAYDILKSDPIGNEAKMIIDSLYDELNQLSSEMERASAEDVLEISDEIDIKRREIRQMSSLYDIAGKLKEGKEKEIAERLQQFNEATRDIYTSEEIPDALQNAYQAYEQKLTDEGKKPGSVEYENLLTKWKERNVRTVLKDEFWSKMDSLNTAVKNILANVPQQEEINLRIEKNYAIIKDMVKGSRDESGQPLGNELSPEKQAIVKAAQEQIDRDRESLNTLSGLNKSEQNEMSIIMSKLTDRQKLSQQETVRLSQLLDKQSRLHLNKVQRAELNSLFSELDELRSKEPTDSYIDAVNDYLSTINREALYDALKVMQIDKNNAFRLADTELMDKLFELNPDFEEWFKRNHILKEGLDIETNTPKERWERTYAWNVIKPRDEKYYESTSIKNLAGETVSLQGLPSLKYFKRLVKDEYLTPEIVGQTKDNRGYWLPKTMAQGAADDRYVNKEYLQLRSSDPKLFALLEKMKEIHLQNQEGAEGRAKLWLDMPRFRKELVERLQSEQPVQRLVDKVKTFWTKVKDGWENGFNYDDNLNLIKLDLIDNEANGIPIAGLSNLPISEVSTDIIYTTMKYMLQVERNKALTETAPIARMIQRVVNDKKNIPSEERLAGSSIINFVGGKKSRYVRQKAVNNFIEKTYEGVQNVGFGADSAIAQNFSNFLFKRASTTFLAFNIPSAIKNALGQKWQGFVEAAAGKNLSPKTLIQAEKWATATTFKYTTEIYKNGPKSLDIQIVELFDPERGKFQNTFGQSFTRTPGKDTLNAMDRLNDFRQWVQLQASLQTLGGMMLHERIPTKSGGTINYMDAWELRDNKIHLKDSIDPTYGVTYDADGNLVLGDKFLALRNKYQRTIDLLNGSMGREQRPEADRYLLFRYVSFFRRFLTSMLVNRFAYSGSILKGTSKGRFDYNLGEGKQGWYIEFTKLLLNTFKTLGKNLPFMTSDEKAAALRMLTEVGTVSLIKFAVIPLVFGFDDDDPDRFKKLKAKSGSLPLPFIHEDPNNPFQLDGWLSNHILLQFLQVNNENDQFIFFPGYGLNNAKEMLDIKSAVAGPTIKSWINILNDVALMVAGDEKAYYARTSNAYEWGQEGDAKIYSHIAKSFGFNASTADPVTSLKNFQNLQSQ